MLVSFMSHKKNSLVAFNTMNVALPITRSALFHFMTTEKKWFLRKTLDILAIERTFLLRNNKTKKETTKIL